MSNYMKIKPFDIANGKGIRTSIFFSGCHFHCKGCFNSEAWNFNSGKPFTREVYEQKIKPTITKHISGISILGGEPLHIKNIKNTCLLINWFKEDFPNKNIWLWTGYTLEELIDIVEQREIPCDGFWLEDILFNIDILVDVQFILEQRDLSLEWRGSRNQRVIDVKKSMNKNKIV